MRTVRRVAPALAFFWVTLVAVGLSCRALAGDGSSMTDALEQYTYKRYHAASQAFEKVINANPRNVKAHFYLGRCFEILKDPDNAKEEYAIAFQLNPFDEQGRAAREALLHLASSVEQAKHPTDGPEAYTQALRQISAQSADNQQRWLNWGEREANFRMHLGAIETNMTDANTRAALRGLRGSSTVAREISNDNIIRKSYQLTDTQVQARKYRTDAANAARFTQESANSLKSLLSEHPKDSAAPRLRPLGTNLYVRNYGDYDDDLPPPDPPLELRATAKSFSDLPPEPRAHTGKL